MLVPLPSWAQTVSAGVNYSFQRMMSKIAAGSGSGLVVKQPGTMSIVNAGKVVGSFSLNEKRLLDLATLAKYARASAVPAVIALGATELVKYGLEKCADGSWCKPEPGDPNDEHLIWYAANSAPGSVMGPDFNSPQEACSWAAARLPGLGAGTLKLIGGNPHGGYYQCLTDGGSLFSNINHRGCEAGFSLSNGVCVRTSPAPTVPATGTDVEAAWKTGFQTDPFLQERYWGFEDQTQNNKAWAEALAQTAELITSTVTEVRPAESTTKPKVGGGTETTTKQTTCTYTATANSDAATLVENPVKVSERCVTTTTAPDGTQTQEVTEKAATPQGQAKVPEKVDIETCGLPGKPACKIDETGTPTEQAGKDKITAAQTELTTARQDAEQQLRNAAQVSTFGLSMPTLLPGGSCQPIQFFKWKAFDGTVDLCERLGFIRTLLSWLWGALAAIYIYNRVSSANA